MAKENAPERLRWAPKIHPDKIRRLYEKEAAGLLSDEWVDEVGIDLLLRVEATLRVMNGQFQCPRCSAVGTAKKEGLQCACSWSASWAAYQTSKRHRDLNVANALPAFEAFARAYPQARKAADKMRLIDRLIHEFHWDAKFKVPNRSVGNNLIEGSHQDVVALLDQLSSRNGVDKEAWREITAQMWARRRGD